MDSKKLAKVVKVIASAEVKRQLPALVEAEVNKRMSKVLTEIKKLQQNTIVERTEEEQDAFSLANQVLKESRRGEVQKSMLSMLDKDDEEPQLSKNPMIDTILKQTQPFTAAQRTAGGPVGFEQSPRVQRLNEGIREGINEGYEEWPTMGGGALDSSKFNMAPTQGVPQDIRTQMAEKMGYGDMATGPQKNGLGVTTGLPGLDRILNRDNSALVKAMTKKR